LFFGICTIFTLRPLLSSVSFSHGPVTQKAALPARNAFFAMP